MLTKLVPSIMGWVVVVITLALAPTIETFNGHVTTNVAAAVNSANMIGMTAIDDFGGFLIILALLIGGGLFAVISQKTKSTSVGDMLQVIGGIILTVVALSMFSGTVIGNIDELITAGSGVAQTVYGVLPIIIYAAIIGASGAFTATKAIRARRRSRRTSRRLA